MKMSYFESHLEGLLGSSIRAQYSGDNLRERLNEVDLGQREFARLVGINHENVNHWEHRRNMPTYENVIKMMVVLYEELRKQNERLREQNGNLVECIVDLEDKVKETQEKYEEEESFLSRLR